MLSLNDLDALAPLCKFPSADCFDAFIRIVANEQQRQESSDLMLAGPVLMQPEGKDETRPCLAHSSYRQDMRTPIGCARSMTTPSGHGSEGLPSFRSEQLPEAENVLR